MIAPLNKNQEVSAKELKKHKSLVLKVTSEETFDEDEDMTYLTRRFQKNEETKRFMKGMKLKPICKCKLPTL